MQNIFIFNHKKSVLIYVLMQMVALYTMDVKNDEIAQNEEELPKFVEKSPEMPIKACSNHEKAHEKGMVMVMEIFRNLLHSNANNLIVYADKSTLIDVFLKDEKTTYVSLSMKSKDDVKRKITQWYNNKKEEEMHKKTVTHNTVINYPKKHIESDMIRFQQSYEIKRLQKKSNGNKENNSTPLNLLTNTSSTNDDECLFLLEDI